jgi:putative spermidine/putrescine transport system substrate-binding protein
MSINRRLFLASLGTWFVSQGLAGCNQQQTQLSVYLLRNSIPLPLIKRCQQQLASSGLSLSQQVEIESLFSLLQNWKTTPPKPDAKPEPTGLVSLGDYWLAKAIEQQLIQPLELSQLPRWQQLPQPWQRLVTRDRQGNPAPNGQIWAAPYRWGMTVLAYNKDRFADLGWTPTDWADLWRPELRRRFSLLDHPREVIGLTLKKMGQSYNTENLSAVANLETELIQLQRQVKVYSNDAYLQSLSLGDTWAAVGWSHDVLPLMRRNPKIGAVIPRSGTALWADLWVQQATALPQVSSAAAPLIRQWIDFWWQPEIAAQLTQFSNGLSPMTTDWPAKSLLANPLPSLASTLERCEFLQPLSEAVIAQYRSLWQETRKIGVS